MLCIGKFSRFFSLNEIAKRLANGPAKIDEAR